MAIKYVPYFPNTLEGQAILDNFVRTKRVLRYRDNDQVIERIERGCIPQRARYPSGSGIY